MYARRSILTKYSAPTGELPPLEPREVRRFIDPDATGTPVDGTTWDNAYRDTDQWESSERTNLVTPDNWHHVYLRASAGSNISGARMGAGWVTGPANYILMETAPGQRALKTGWLENIVRMQGNLDIRANHFRVDGLQIEHTNTCITSNLQAADNNDIRISNCRLRRSLSSGTSTSGIVFESANTIAKIENCIITGFTNTGFSSGVTIFSTSVDIYHTVIMDCSIGIRQLSGIVTAINNAVFSCTDDFSGTIIADHNASDDGDGTNSVSPFGSDWNNEFSDPSISDPNNGNFTLINGRNLHLGGTPITGGPINDIDGDPWNAITPSIGADEYV